MERTTVIVATLLVYHLVLVAIGFWASGRSRSEEDFFLGGRALGPVVAAISYAASASSAWTLLGLSGAAYVMGVSVVWVAGGSITGMLVAWFWIGRRLMHHTRAAGQITFIGFMTGDATGAARRWIVGAASLIVIFSFTFYIAAQFQGAGNLFTSSFGLPMSVSILIGAFVIMLYTLLGGFWAVSVTDVVQGLLMALAAIVLPVAAVSAAGGVDGFLAGLREVSTPEQLSLTAGNAGWVAAGMVLGGLGIGFGTYGQPHMMVRFMALRDERALRRARVLTIAWYLIVFAGMVTLGLAAHVLEVRTGNPENVFFVVTESLLPAVVGALMLVAALSAIMSTADSQLLVVASSITCDLGFGRKQAALMLVVSRLTIVALVAVAVCVALWLPERIFSRVLFAWTALGAAFGPTLFLRLAGRAPRAGSVLASILTGFGLAIVCYLLPDTPGDVLERLAPFAASLAILVLGSLGSRPGPCPTIPFESRTESSPHE